MFIFLKRNITKKLKVFFIYIICFASLIGIQLVLRYYFFSKELYFIAIRLQLIVEFILLTFYFNKNFQNLLAKKLAISLIPVYILFSIFDYILNSKIKFGADQAIVESIFMLFILIYYFFEKIKFDIQSPLYEYKIFWIAVGFFIFFAGNFFLLITSKTMIDDLRFRQQYIFVYSTFNVFKNIILSIAIIINENNRNDSINKIASAIDDKFFFSNPS